MSFSCDRGARSSAMVTVEAGVCHREVTMSPWEVLSVFQGAPQCHHTRSIPPPRVSRAVRDQSEHFRICQVEFLYFRGASEHWLTEFSAEKDPSAPLFIHSSQCHWLTSEEARFPCLCNSAQYLGVTVTPSYTPALFSPMLGRVLGMEPRVLH